MSDEDSQELTAFRANIDQVTDAFTRAGGDPKAAVDQLRQAADWIEDGKSAAARAAEKQRHRTLIEGILGLNLSTRLTNALLWAIGVRDLANPFESSPQRDLAFGRLSNKRWKPGQLMSFDEWKSAVLEDEQRQKWVTYIRNLGERSLAELLEALREDQ